MSKQKSLFLWKTNYSNYIENINFMFLLWGNQIGDQGCTALSRSLPHLKNLAQLVISSNWKLFESTIQLVYILNFKITVLDEFVIFFFLNVKTKITFFLGKNIYSNHIENINFMCLLWENQIGDKGFIALSTSLPHLTSLTELYLDSKSKKLESIIQLVYILNFKITVLDEFAILFFLNVKTKITFLNSPRNEVVTKTKDSKKFLWINDITLIQTIKNFMFYSTLFYFGEFEFLSFMFFDF
jgi:hypothetical protein